MGVEAGGAKPKRIASGKPFQKGKAPGPGRGHKKAKPQVGEDMAADMRLAYTTAELPGDKPGVKHARILLHENYERFMMLYARVAPPLGKMAASAERKEELLVGPKEEKVAGMVAALLLEFRGSVESVGRAALESDSTRRDG